MAELHLTRRQREDPLVIAWVRIQDWVLAHARIIGAVALAIAVIAGIVLLRRGSRARAEDSASAKVAEASAFYWQGEYDRLLQRADEIRRDFPGTRAATEALRLRGDALFWQGDFKKAAEAYEGYMKENHTASAIRSGVQRNLAQAYESDGQFKRAAEIYEDLAKEPGPRVTTAELLQSAGRTWALAGDTARARSTYERLVAEYGDTPAAAAAEIALGEMDARSAGPGRP